MAKLKQKLDSGERGVALYKNGIFQGYESVVKISAQDKVAVQPITDEELLKLRAIIK
jgi:hypothetical protein|tara:strand:+ start:2627 stop:2797 length:171 start_codon:yes stop_codon:yes gene_type:complete